ncbi:MAG TPA: hypothetical protein VHY91_08795 [Pirellulales bacterium]|jgi:pimeloyl-ACP methyl ester carboxylesterase|nr:hypothetical protein [Pirellulales bacterium]
MHPACSTTADRTARRSALGLFALAAALALGGCTSAASWREPTLLVGVAQPGIADGVAAQATLRQAQALDRDGQERAVDLYYLAAVQAQQGLQPCLAGQEAADGSPAQIYCQALSGLIDAGQRYGRLDPRRQLVVVEGGSRVVPIRYCGFAWRLDDFTRLTSTEHMTSRDIAHHYASCGLGLPLVGERIAACQDETFFQPWMPFAVTAVLRPAGDGSMPSGCGEQVLELYNPLAFDTVTWGGAACPLARDLTAPLAAIVNQAPRQYLRGFTAPSDTSVRPQLLLVEPYQRGKIPVIFIHGLYSDPITWVDMINELRAESDLYDRFQFWTFRYPTGGEVLESAAVLRQRLQLARDTFDPEHTDPALDAMVLVGHSLGGLVSEMQVTTSYDLLWRAAAVQQFCALRAGLALQERLSKEFFYEPVPMITRVVFIGTPHQGSGLTRRLAGCIGNDLVSFGTTEKEQYRQLIDQNRDVFKPSLQHHQPTSIDLLDPDSPFLQALAQMPIRCTTHLHSIVGTGGICLTQPGDGVVPVSSARHCGDSELMVPAKHEMLHRDPVSIAEVARILRLHAAETDQAVAVGSIRQNKEIKGFKRW